MRSFVTNEPWHEEYKRAIANSARMVCIVSPAYLASRRCIQELETFVSNAVPSEGRIFKVIKYPVMFAGAPSALRDLLGYQFYVSEPAHGAIRQFDPDPTRPEFWHRLNQIVHDAGNVLRRLGHSGLQQLPPPILTADNRVVGPSSGPDRKLRVFLCHSSADKASVRALYARLAKDGIDPWLDEEKLIAGQKWQEEIPAAVKASDAVVVCMSKSSIGKAGYVQKEIGFALDVAQEQPEGSIFLIPARLEECDVPNRLRDYHWVNLYEESGYARLMLALNARATALGVLSELENAKR